MIQLRPALALAIQIKQPSAIVEEPAWSPSDITNLYFWANFTDISTLYQDNAGTTAVTADGQTIGRVVDANGGALALTQSTSGARPTYKAAIQNGKSVARFATNDFLAVTYGQTLSQPYTLVTITKFNGSSQFSMDGISTSNRGSIFVNSSNNYFTYAGTSFNPGVTRTGGYDLLVSVLSGTATVFRINGRRYAGSAGTQSVTGLRLGAAFDGTSFLDGDIAHAFIINGALLAEDLASLEGWLRDELALAAGYSDHKFQLGGDAGYNAAFDPDRRKFWRFGGDDINKTTIQWVDIDNWVAGVSTATIPASGGCAVWHEGISKFIIYGGRIGGTGGTHTSAIYTFDPATETRATLTETLPSALTGIGAAKVPGSDDVYLFGGWNGTGVVDTIYVHDVSAGTVTDTTANMPTGNSMIGVVWADDVQKFFILGGYDADATSPNVIWTYDPATPASDAVSTGETLSLGLEDQRGAYVDGRIYTFGGYNRDASTYHDIIHRINTNPVAVSVLAETTHRIDDDAAAFYDSQTGKIYVGPWLHSSQVTDNNGPDKRVILEFDVATETLTAEPSLT